jgi:single-stranded DNA-binding protein
VNSVALVGTLVKEPELRHNRAGVEMCQMRIAVVRRDRAGRRQPGVVYVDDTSFGAEARECANRLGPGDRVGLAGRLEREVYRTPKGEWQVDHAVLIDQLDLSTRPTDEHEEETR